MSDDCNINEVQEKSISEVATASIGANPYQPRQHFAVEELEELAASIKQFGVLQPLLVYRNKDGVSYTLIAGERRLRASKMAGLKFIPVIICNYSDKETAEIAMVENLQRKDLNYMEEAEGYASLMDLFSLTQEKIAERVGKKQSTIANKLRLLQLKDSVREILRENKLSERHARALLPLKNEDLQIKALEKIVSAKLNVKSTENLVKSLLEDKKPQKRTHIVGDVRIYLNTIKQMMDIVKDNGIPSSMSKEMDGEDIVVTLRIRNTKGKKQAKRIPTLS